MSEKKKKEVSQKKWTKIIFIVMAVIFAFAMVGSYLTNLVTGLAPIRPGDKVAITYTIYDAAGNPLVTNDQQVYGLALKSGKEIWHSNQLLTLTANQSLNTAVFPVPVYTTESNGGSWNQFALFSPEYVAITQGLVGMRTSEKKNIVFNGNMSMSKIYSPSDLPQNTTVNSFHVGDVLTMGLSNNPNATASSPADISYRIGEVTRVSPAGVVVDFGYPRADITIVSITKG